jgi:hypothetical protein
VQHIKSLSRDALTEFVNDNIAHLLEEEALFVLANRNCTAAICNQIARSARLTAFYSVRLKLAAHRQTPQAHAVKLVHYLYWADLLRLSIDVKVPAQVRRTIDTIMLQQVTRLTLGDKISAARRCSAALMKVLLYDPDPKIFAALLTNPRLREEDLVALASSTRATPEQLRMLGEDQKWSYRYSIRKTLVLNPLTPRSVAASQLRHLRRDDLRAIHSNPATSVYLQRCIERLRGIALELPDVHA